MEVSTPAERMYRNHLKNVKTYQQKNPEKMRDKCKKYNERIKAENPEKHQANLSKKRAYYFTIVKPKRELEKKSKN